MPPRRWLAAAPLVVGVAVAAAVLFHPGLRALVESLDRYNPTPHLPTDLVIGIGVALAVGYSSYVWPLPEADRALLRRAWWVHVLVALGPLLYLESVEDSIDGFRHYREAVAGGSPLGILESGLDTRFVNLLAWFPITLLGGSYQATKLLFVLPGIFGGLLMARAAGTFVGRHDRRPLVLFLFFPSLLFWGSFFGKEGFTYLAVGLYVYGGVSAFQAPSWRGAVYLAAGLAIAAWLRPWLVLIFVVPLFILPLTWWRGNPRLATKVVAVVGLVASAALAYVSVRFGVADIDGFVARAHALTHDFGYDVAGRPMGPGDTGRVAPPLRSIGDVLLFLPIGMFTVLFLPLPWQGTHPVLVFGGLESLFLAGVVISGVATTVARRRFKAFRRPMFLWLSAVILLWAAAYAFAVYYNAGLAVRTRTMVVPFILLLPLALADAARREGTVVADDRRSFRARVADLRRRRPVVVESAAGRAALPALAAAWLTGVPVRRYSPGPFPDGFRECLARELASDVRPSRSPDPHDREAVVDG